MLSNEWMGAFCLGVVWLNTLLIVMHVLQAERALAREKAALGTVMHAKAIGACVAELRVAQIGRAITSGGPRRIVFTDVSTRAKVDGGELEIAGAKITLAASGDARIWWLGEGGERSDKDFDAAYARADSNRGLASELVVALDATLWLSGEGDPLRARIVSDRDPRRVIASGRGRAIAFVIGALVVLGGITALALVRPWFSGWSTLGGVLAVAYFLAVQPLAVALRENIAPPDQRKIGGSWSA